MHAINHNAFAPLISLRGLITFFEPDLNTRRDASSSCLGEFRNAAKNRKIRFATSLGSVYDLGSCRLISFSCVRPMHQTVATKLAPRSIVAGMMLAMLVVGAEQRAEAGCSHLVTSKATRENLQVLTGLRLLDDNSIAVDADTARIPEGQRPCSGPSCSRKEGVPTVPIVINLVVFDRWCVIGEAPCHEDQSITRLFFESTRPRPRYLNSPIERPPRFTA